MKLNIIVYVAVFLPVIAWTSGCARNRHLTTEAAQSAVDSVAAQMAEPWQLEPNATAKVIGVTENEQENTAIADVTFGHFVFRCVEPIGEHEIDQSWTSGKARFRHYTDGKWVLTDIVSDNGFFMKCGSAWRGNVAVK